MKNKKLKYPLIVLTVLIWGVVFYKIFSYTSSTSDFVPTEVSVSFSDTMQPVNDTFTLLANYSDPFLKHERIRHTNSEINPSGNQKISSTFNNPKNQKHSRPPANTNNSRKRVKNITFGGEIINLNSQEKTGLIIIDNRNFLVHAKDIIQGITILEIYSDSVMVLENDEKRTILKSKK